MVLYCQSSLSSTKCGSDKGSKWNHSYLTKPKYEGQKEVRNFVPTCTWLQAQFLHTCTCQNVCALFMHTPACVAMLNSVCAHSHVSVQLFYQTVTECQPLCVIWETAERRLLPSSSSHSDDYSLVKLPLFSPHREV